MLDFTCGYFLNNKLVEGKISELNLKKKILLCSVVRPVDEFSITYVHYLNSLLKNVSNKIDQLFIIDGHHENWIHPTYNCRFPHIVTLTDKRLELLTYLKKTYNIDHPLEKLNQHWSYQIYINDGKIEKFYYQPIEPNWNVFVTHQNVKKFFKEQGARSVLLKKLSNVFKNNDSGFWNPIYVSDHLLPIKVRFPTELRRLGRYYNIWPNHDLETYLQNT